MNTANGKISPGKDLGSFATLAAIRRASSRYFSVSLTIQRLLSKKTARRRGRRLPREREKFCRVANLRHAHSLERAAFKMFVSDCFDEMSQ